MAVKESHFMQFRLGDREDVARGTISAAMAQVALDSYLSQGWEIVSAAPAGANQDGVQFIILLTRVVPTATK